MYPTHADPIGCIMLTLWPHKYKVGHTDLILIKHLISCIHLKILNFHMCHIKTSLREDGAHLNIPEGVIITKNISNFSLDILHIM